MSLMRQYGSRITRLVIVATAALGLIAADALARPGSSGSMGSRGSRTFSAPPPTATAPKTVQPMQKSMTQPGSSQGAAAAATASAAQAARPSLMRNLLLGGLIGAGFAMLFGSGPLSAVLGFLLQTALIAGLVYLAVMFFRSRSGAPSLATASAGGGAGPQNANYRQAATAMGGGAGGALAITGDDYNAFERLLGDVQASYGRGDVNSLGRLATPEMLSYFASELEENRRKGVRNELGSPKLLQGDLSEAWSESGGDYATVAMRYSLTDATIDQSGRVVSGSRTVPQEVTEVWTFRRDRGAGSNGWELSAIQQV